MLHRFRRTALLREALVAELIVMPAPGTVRRRGWEFVRYPTAEGTVWSACRLDYGHSPVQAATPEEIADFVIEKEQRGSGLHRR